MARPKKQTLGDAEEKKVTENFLKENPEGVPDELPEQKVVVSKHIPVMKEVVFVNQRDPGVMLEFHYKSKTYPMQHFKLMDGETYSLAEEIIDHLESCSIPIYGKETEEKGHFFRPVIGHRYMFAFRNPKTFRKSA